MKLRFLDRVISDCMAHIKGAIADTNKPVLGKADRKRLISIRKKIRHMKRELDELDNICSLRISYTLEGVNVSNYRDKQTGDRLAGLSEK